MRSSFSVAQERVTLFSAVHPAEGDFQTFGKLGAPAAQARRYPQKTDGFNFLAAQSAKYELINV